VQCYPRCSRVCCCDAQLAMTVGGTQSCGETRVRQLLGTMAYIASTRLDIGLECVLSVVDRTSHRKSTLPQEASQRQGGREKLCSLQQPPYSQLRKLPHTHSISSPPVMSAPRAFSTALRAGAPRAPIAARVAGIRSYAAAAPAAGPASKPPVALFGVDGTYASALVRLLEAQLAVWETRGMNWRSNGWNESWANETYSTPRLRKPAFWTPPRSRLSRSPPCSRRTRSSPRS
jgi:hypothetical protein